jgi:hypothetical protein
MSPAIKHGLSWIIDQYKGHPEDAITAAQNNAVNFFGQVNICLEGQQQIQGAEDKTKLALADPDYTSLFQEAVLGAALTNSEQKHKILARLVTDRLIAEPDTLRTLAAHMACSAVPQLSPPHLRFLGLMAVIYVMDTPAHLKATEEVKGFDSYDTRIKKGLEWLSEELAPLLPIGDMAEYDYAHLAAVSCIAYGQANHDLLNVMIWSFSTKGGSRSIIEQTDIGKTLLQYWDQDMVCNAFLTPAGALIGAYAHDALTSDRHKWAL